MRFQPLNTTFAADPLFPFQKEYNRTNISQLSFNALKAELNNIKICELKIDVLQEKKFSI